MALENQALILDCVVFDLQLSGGISRYWYNLVSGLARERTANHIFLSINRETENIFGKTLLATVTDDIHVTVHQRKENRISRYLPPRLRTLPESVGLFHSSYYRFNPRARANVVTVHDFTYERHRQGVPAKVHCWQKSLAIKRSSQIICVSQSTRRDLLAYHPMVDPARVHVIYHGLESVFCGSTIASPPPLRPYVLFVGDRSEYKNFKNVAVALSLLPDLRLVAVGAAFSVEEKAWLNALIPQRFEAQTGLSDEALASLYRSAFALAYPSSYEGFGMPVVEAMACGCPVVALNSSSIPEISGRAAILLEESSPESIRSAMALLRNPVYRNELRALGRTEAIRFKWTDSIEKHMKIYDLALSRTT